MSNANVKGYTDFSISGSVTTTFFFSSNGIQGDMNVCIRGNIIYDVHLTGKTQTRQTPTDMLTYDLFQRK